jgi:hypothetical protein
MRSSCVLRAIPVLAAAVALAAPSTSYRTTYSTFREDVGGLSVYADGYPASLGPDDAYVPVPVAIALMRTGPSVAFTPESFTLADAHGNRVRAAEFADVKNGYPKLAHDRSLVRVWPINIAVSLEDRPRIASNFYPPTGAGTRISRVELAPYSWFSDVIYFPRPPSGLDGVLTLSVAVAGGDPVEVRFLMNRDELAKR